MSRFTLIGFTRTGSTQTYEARAEVIAASAVKATVEPLAPAGYVVTGAYYDYRADAHTIVALKLAGETRPYAARVEHVASAADLRSATSAVAAGYVVTAVTSDNGPYTLFAFKR